MLPNFLFACRLLNIVNMWYYPQWIASMQLIYQVKMLSIQMQISTKLHVTKKNIYKKQISSMQIKIECASEHLERFCSWPRFGCEKHKKCFYAVFISVYMREALHTVISACMLKVGSCSDTKQFHFQSVACCESVLCPPADLMVSVLMPPWYSKCLYQTEATGITSSLLHHHETPQLQNANKSLTLCKKKK